ncbi:MAG: peptide ABC transporter substrate-binding protein [Chloroflexi bacterium]|nr:MAG: peptide ABC transporter substrate-binding protein [Chloroflexota bacterium]
MNRRWLWWLLATAVLLMACRLGEVVSRSGTAVSRNETINLLGSQPRTLDPAKTHGGPDSPLGHIFSGLVTLDTSLQVQPDLAAGWHVSEDGLVYTFYLRPNAVFHNGRPVTAQDVIFSWERAASPATQSDTAQTYLGDIAGVDEMLAGTADHISGLRAIDDHTLEVRLTAPVVYFLAKLTYPVAFVVDKENVSQPDWEHHPNGTGPFRLVRWQDDEEIILERNEAFYRTPARVARVVYNLGPGLPMTMYENNEIDLVGIGGDTLARALDPNSEFYDELQTTVTMCTTVIGLNNRIPPFDDVRVRQAFNYALDKERLIETFDNGNALPARGPLPPGMPGYTGAHPGYPFDPERARALLAEAGYEHGADLPVLTYTTAGYGDVSEFVTAVVTMWQENLGVTIHPVILDPFTYLDELYAGNIGNLYSGGWCADYPDPSNFLDILYHTDSTQNLPGYSNPLVDEQLEAARVEQNVARRLEMYAEIERMVIEDAPVVFVRHGITAVLVKPRLQNYILTPIGVAQWHTVSLEK